MNWWNIGLNNKIDPRYKQIQYFGKVFNLFAAGKVSYSQNLKIQVKSDVKSTGNCLSIQQSEAVTAFSCSVLSVSVSCQFTTNLSSSLKLR